VGHAFLVGANLLRQAQGGVLLRKAATAADRGRRYLASGGRSL